MIAMITGELIDVNEDHCVVMAAGVGYELSCSLGTLADLQESKHQQVQLYVHTHVREDALQLFGFRSRLEKTLFLSLLKVNGIGPKSAVNILSGASVGQIAEMIDNEDVKSLSKLPKVGKKTAEQMILTLKGKLIVHPEGAASRQVSQGPRAQISSALINLGFRAVDVEKVVGSMGEISLEEGIRQGLAALTSL